MEKWSRFSLLCVDGFVRRDEASIVQALPRVSQLDRNACRRSVETHFSAERMVAEHIAVYEQAITAVAERSAMALVDAL